jgi:hypothetical protein
MPAHRPGSEREEHPVVEVEEDVGVVLAVLGAQREGGGGGAGGDGAQAQGADAGGGGFGPVEDLGPGGDGVAGEAGVGVGAGVDGRDALRIGEAVEAEGAGEGRPEFTSVILTYLKSIATRGKRFIGPFGRGAPP